MQQWWHLPNLKSPCSRRLTESWSLAWNWVGGNAGADFSPVLPVYTENQANIHNMNKPIPRFWFSFWLVASKHVALKDFFPFSFTICSSTQTSWPILYTCLNFSVGIIGRSLYGLSWHSSVRAGCLDSSTSVRWKFCHSCQNLLTLNLKCNCCKITLIRGAWFFSHNSVTCESFKKKLFACLQEVTS